MGFFITEAETEKLLTHQERPLSMPDGTSRLFGGFALIWRAYDFLVVCGNWEPLELVSLALRVKEGETATVASLLPNAHGRETCVSLLEIRMLESPRIDPAEVRPIKQGEERELSLDEHFHNVVASLYRDLQNRLG